MCEIHKDYTPIEVPTSTCNFCWEMYIDAAIAKAKEFFKYLEEKYPSKKTI